MIRLNVASVIHSHIRLDDVTNGFSLDTDESQDVVVAHDSRRDSVSSQSLAHGCQGSRDFSRDRNYRRRKSSSHRSHPESRTGSSFSRAFHQLSALEPEYVSPSQESCRGHQPGSLHPGTDSSQHLVGINERVDYVDCFTHALSQFANGEQNSHPTLMLVKAKVRDVYNRLQELTILLDSASHFSSMTTAAANKLGFHIPNTEMLNPTNFGGNLTTEDDEDEEDDVSRLWNLERLGTTHSHEDEHTTVNTRVLEEFEGTSEVSEGYLYVRFPWKDPHPQLGDNKQLAHCRLIDQYHRLRQNPAVWSSYCAAIQQHLDSGFIEEVGEYVFDSPLVYYIPHQAVYKESSSTTTLSVAFDASSHMKAQLLLKEMDINISQIYFFLSSQITLHWIHTSRPLEQFARNWEQGIPAKFHYVSAEDNPANCAIRGMSTNANGEMWWNGPSFLKDHPDNWPNVGMDFSIPPVATSEQDQEFTEILSRVSAALQARLLQAIPALNNLSSDNIITAQDFQLAETFLIREHYRESEHALDQLHLDRLNIHRDEMGLIRCSGHLENAQSTSPVLLVPSHPLTRLVVLQVHTSLYHQGVYSTVAHLCTRFFIPFTYGNVGKFLSTCVICKEVTSCPQQYPDTSSLPAERVTISRPFQKVVRRGTPELVYTNCATDDGKEALNKIFLEHGLWDKIQQFSTIYKITWKFVTCVSPWKEGFYESKALGDRLLKQDQLHTVVVEIEKIINSRPITPYCEKSSLIQVLRPHDFTPSQFTLPLVADTFDIVFEGHRSTDWRKDTLDVLDQFWSTWRSGYLSVLAQRHQSRLCQSQYTHTHLRVNDVVNIGNGDVPRGQWKLGIVTEFIANKKGIVRSAKVRIPRDKRTRRSQSTTKIYGVVVIDNSSAT
ncbi:hypothetical protein ANCCEY_09074 [Ancylostoma ceylanicum]|uniref:DUF5641 domain-containing protein n=1 Tax=Ancylostoma ceylanicum TaxID=53326 RepID=A0A0D6LPB2_9BILA|nr:hypothetical protein ANCCEY_09074 [Ancylostoma ceylanicum]